MSHYLVHRRPDLYTIFSESVDGVSMCMLPECVSNGVFFFRQRELARQANEQPKDIVNFFLLPPWSVDARKFSTHATISADSWPISQLRMDWYIRRGSGRSPKKQVRAAESSNTSTVVGWTGKTATHVVTFSRLSIVVALTVLYHSCTTRSVLVSD